jgi:hypothetical protein
MKLGPKVLEFEKKGIEPKLKGSYFGKPCLKPVPREWPQKY